MYLLLVLFRNPNQKIQIPDLFAASLMMVDVNHNKSKALWDPEVFYDSSKEEKAPSDPS